MSDWDGLRGCAICGNDTTGRLCRSCAEQEAIDNDDADMGDGFMLVEDYDSDQYGPGGDYEDDDTDAMFALWDPYPAPWYDGNPGPLDENTPNGRYIGPGSETLPNPQGD